MTPELAKGIAGPPFGAVEGSADRLPAFLSNHRTAAARMPVQSAIEIRKAVPPGMRLVTSKAPTCIRAYG